MGGPADTTDAIQHTTNDLAQATYLAMQGYEFTMQKDGEQYVRFVFKVRSEDRQEFRKMVREYNASEARVEPLRYTRELGAIRARMYRFMDGNSD